MQSPCRSPDLRLLSSPVTAEVPGNAFTLPSPWSSTLSPSRQEPCFSQAPFWLPLPSPLIQDALWGFTARTVHWFAGVRMEQTATTSQGSVPAARDSWDGTASRVSSCLASLRTRVTFLEGQRCQAARLPLFPVVWAMVSYQHSPPPLLRTSGLESVLAVFPPDSEWHPALWVEVCKNEGRFNFSIVSFLACPPRSFGRWCLGALTKMASLPSWQQWIQTYVGGQNAG